MCTNFLIEVTTNHIIEHICVHQKLKRNFLRLVFRGLLINLTTKYTFTLTFSGRYMVKMDVLIPSKPLLLRFFDEIYSRQQLEVNPFF